MYADVSGFDMAKVLFVCFENLAPSTNLLLVFGVERQKSGDVIHNFVVVPFNKQ